MRQIFYTIIKCQSTYSIRMVVIFTTVLVFAATSLTTSALSQTETISIDLSVLQDGGHDQTSINSHTVGQLKLLMPGPTSPRSSYFGPPVIIADPIVITPSTSVSASTTKVISTEDSANNDPSVLEVSQPEVPEAPDVLTAKSEVEMAGSEDETGSAIELTPSAADTTIPAEPDTIESGDGEKPTSNGNMNDLSSTIETATSTSSLEDGIRLDHTLQVVFSDSESALPRNFDDYLTSIADNIKGSDNLRIQLMAYAGGNTLSASKARRLSLSRALSVRAFFIESGVRSTRIDVRALGNKTSEEPFNRVDINIVER